MEMKYFECPAEAVKTPDFKHVFLAGGITNCYNWQREISLMLQHTPNLALFNPRRSVYDYDDPKLGEEQIHWEHRHLTAADGIIFWFAEETLQPITLFELGKWLNKVVAIGIHPNYKRKFDVEIQVGIERPDLKIVNSIEDLADQIENCVA
jgi:hypothetical protein